MPVNLSIKGVPDSLADRLRSRAVANRRSLQRELMAIIELAATIPGVLGTDVGAMSAASRLRQGQRVRPIEEIAEELDRLFPRPRTRGPTSAEIIRAMRDERLGAVSAVTPGTRRPRERPGSR